MEIYTQQ